jgi:hypothetical protein
MTSTIPSIELKFKYSYCVSLKRLIKYIFDKSDYTNIFHLFFRLFCPSVVILNFDVEEST